MDALRTPDGERLLAEVAARGDADVLATVAALRRRYEAGLVAAAVTQVRLRSRARAKFGADADRMFFTADGLEQATRAVVAERHAARFVDAGADRVLDLCCGIGGDLLAFARAGLRATGVDRDPDTVEVARANLAAFGLPGTVRGGRPPWTRPGRPPGSTRRGGPAAGGSSTRGPARRRCPSCGSSPPRCR